MLESEQGFAHLALPMGPGLVLRANGPLSPGPEQYKKMIYEKGQAAAPGDRVIITAMEVKNDRIVFDFNGGPYAKHRFLSHISLNDAPMATQTEQPVGSRLTLIFEGGLPEISAPEVKALMQPVVDFGVKTSEQAYADTLPAPIKNAIETHEVLVGMTHRMVLAAMGAPEQKIRDQASPEAGGGHYEEWIYGHVPQTVKFVRFVGDRVTLVEIAALGKPLDIHDKNEMGEYAPPPPTREIAMGDGNPSDGDSAAKPPPTLRQPGEAVENVPGAGGKVQFPDSSSSNSAAPIPPPPGSSDSSNLPNPSNSPNSSTMPNSGGTPRTPGVHPTVPTTASEP
jgi:hypothetical protein